MRSFPARGAEAAGAEAAGSAPGDGVSLHAETATPTRIEKHSCTVRFILLFPPTGAGWLYRRRTVAAIVEASVGQIQTAERSGARLGAPADAGGLADPRPCTKLDRKSTRLNS